MSAPPAHLDTNDAAVHYDKLASRWMWEDSEGNSWEWRSAAEVTPGQQSRDGRWLPVASTEEILRQQEGYSVKGVDESVGIFRACYSNWILGACRTRLAAAAGA